MGLGSIDDISGKRFGILTAISFVGTDKHKHAVWSCKCDCGAIKNIRANHLKAGGNKSCGCLQKTGRPPIHGHGSRKNGLSPTYQSWRAMRMRCEDRLYKDYRYYGGRGIRVYPEWLDFNRFISDMGERPTGCVLGRIDHDDDYKPGNVAWQTVSDNAKEMHSRHTRAA